MKNIFLIGLLFLAGCGQIKPVAENTPQGEKQKRMAISQTLGAGTVVEEKIEVQVKPEEIIPAVTEQLTRKELNAKIDEANVDIQMALNERDGAEIKLVEARAKKEQLKLLLTQFKK